MATNLTGLRAVDLFAGCGGLTTGLKLAGFDVVAAVEFEKGALKAYGLNHPEVTHVYGMDIREVNGDRILQDIGLARGELDLLAGCPPCQGFSRMRTLNRGAADDPRNDLVHEYLRLVDELLPRALLLENVPGLARDSRYHDLVEEVKELGYNVSDEVHDAADYGIPQRRRRLIMLAARGVSVKMPEPVDAGLRRTVRDTIEGLPEPGSSGDPAHDVSEKRQPHVKRIIELIPRDGGSRTDLNPEYELECHRKVQGFFDVYGRMSWDDVSPTITSGFVNPSKGRFLHPDQNRCVTPREAALLQTFPADYRFPMKLGKYPVAKMIGNALPPQLARTHALAIANALGPE